MASQLTEISWVDHWVPMRLREDDETWRKARLLVNACYMVIGLTVLYSILYLAMAYYPGLAICLYGCFSAAGLLFHFRKHGNFVIGGNFFAFTSFVFFAAFALTTYGLGTLVIAWLMIVPLSGFLLANIRSGLIWTGLTMVLLTSIFILQKQDLLLPSIITPEQIDLVNYFSLLGLIGFTMLTVLNYERGKSRGLRKLREINRENEYHRKLLERQNSEISKINAGLESLVNQRTMKLIATNEELDTFLYESSHALRRPLLRIQGLLNLLRLKDIESEREHYRNLIDQTCLGMDEMLRDLILVSEMNQYQPEFIRFDLSRLLKRLLEKMEERFPDAREVCTLNLPAPLEICQDRYLLEQALFRILENALQYRSSRPLQIQVGFEVEDLQLTLRIRDNGMGIHPEIFDRAKQMFVRGTEHSQGSGLGLYITEKSLERIQGTLDMQPLPEGGTEAVITLSLMDLPFYEAEVPATPD